MYLTIFQPFCWPFMIKIIVFVVNCVWGGVYVWCQLILHQKSQKNRRETLNMNKIDLQQQKIFSTKAFCVSIDWNKEQQPIFLSHFVEHIWGVEKLKKMNFHQYVGYLVALYRLYRLSLVHFWRKILCNPREERKYRFTVCVWDREKENKQKRETPGTF